MISILSRVFSNSVVVVCEKRKTMPISLSSKYRGRTAAASKQNILVSGLRMDLRFGTWTCDLKLKRFFLNVCLQPKSSKVRERERSEHRKLS